MSDITTAEERAAQMRIEKQHREEMLSIRMNFREPRLERDGTLPNWVQLLDEKKRAAVAAESEILGRCSWFTLLNRQCPHVEHGALNASTNISQTLSSVQRQNPQSNFASSWLRQLEREGSEGSA